MPKFRVGVLGATSIVGKSLLARFPRTVWRVTAFSRSEQEPGPGLVEWRKLPSSLPLISAMGECESIPYWICAAPIWVLPEHFTLLELCGARKVVAVSSTSRFTKNHSSDPEEQIIARRLAESEERLKNWAGKTGVEWIILHPTLIYGNGQDKNISEIARFISRFGFFPVFGKAQGLRQPIHYEDVAAVCVSALFASHIKNRSYNITGGETLTYREMVSRIFATLGRRPRLLTVPLWVFRISVAVLRRLPRYRKWSTAMAERMNQDLVFDHTDAVRDLGFKPKEFSLSKTVTTVTMKAL